MHTITLTTKELKHLHSMSLLGIQSLTTWILTAENEISKTHLRALRQEYNLLEHKLQKELEGIK